MTTTISTPVRTRCALSSALALIASLAFVHSAQATDLNGTITGVNQTITDQIISTGFTYTAGSLTIEGSATSNVTGQILLNSGSNLFFGQNGSLQTVNAASVQLQSAQFFMRSGSLINSGTFTLNNTDTYTQTGGAVTTNGFMSFANGGTSSISTVNISGGSLTSTNGTVNGTNLAVRGTSTVNLSGTGTLTASTLNMTTNQLSGGAAGSTVNLNGGTLVTGRIIKGLNGTTGTQTFNFNGGTLKASATSTTYMTGLTNAFVKAGGAVIDTQAFNVTIGQNLLTDAASTGGGLTKAGTGTLTLTGTNTYTGATIVSAGTLALSGSGSINASASLNVASGATFANTGVGFNKALTVTEGALFTGTTVAFTPTSLTISGNLADGFSSLNFVSSLTKAGLLTVNLSNTAVGTYSLISSATTESFTSVSVAGTTLASSDGNATFTGNDGVFNYTYANAGNALQVSAFSAVPEPSTYATLAGLGILGFAVSRRRTSRV